MADNDCLNTSAIGQGPAVDSATIQSIADQLMTLAENLLVNKLNTSLSQKTFNANDDVESYLKLARQAYVNRRLRSSVFGDESLFGEPAWDLLLDIFIRNAEDKPLSVTAACIGAIVPVSTALRWVITLEQQGLVMRVSDARDARRAFLQLTDKGRDRMLRYFERVARARREPVLT